MMRRLSCVRSHDRCGIAVILPAMIAASGLFVGGADAVELIANGSFESPGASSGIVSILAGGTTPSGFAWSLQAGQVEITRQGYVGGSFGQSSFTGPAYDGQQWLDLDGESVAGPGTLQQSFVTTTGSQYELRFGYASNPYRGYPDSAKATVRLFDTTSTADLVTAIQVSHGSSTGSNYDWRTEGPVVFTATGPATTLRFTSNNPANSDAGIFLDGISVTAVPEPSSAVLAATSVVAMLTVRRRSLRLAVD
jgi:hypothetical protein